MCLSSVYKESNGENVFLCKNVARVICDEGKLIIFDLFGGRTEIQGKISDIDLMENTILIKE